MNFLLKNIIIPKNYKEMVFEFASKKLASFDKYGLSPKMHYRTQGSYGTALGGVCSILATLIVLFFMISELYGLIVRPSYNQNKQVQFLPGNN